MFQPQPTPFASSCFASYGLASNLDFGYSLPAGGGGAGTSAGLLYGSQPPTPTQPRPPPQQRAPLPHRQLSTSSIVASSPFTPSTTSTTSPRPHTPSSCNTPPITQHRHQSQQQQQHLHQPRQQHYAPSTSIIVPKMEEEQGHGMAAQQAAAEGYQIVHKGPLVGNKISIDAITNEYAKADPIYVEKTLALPQTYSHYRPIQGDGNCGWRAIGFSYFEKLIESGDPDKVEGEIARLMSFEPMLRNIGGYDYFDDWAEDMFKLLQEIADSMETPDVAHMLLAQRWNDAALTGSIIYYLRLLSATYLKANAAQYEPFLTNPIGGIQGYCQRSIELVDQEIEQLGILALVNVLLEPVDFVLQIVYLDRSLGSQANIYRFPDSANNQDPANLGPIIYLLFRPNHYDILYLRPPPTVTIAIPSAPVSMQINRVSSLSHNTQFTSTPTNLSGFATGDFSTLSMMSGFSSMAGFGGLMSPLPSSSSQPEPYSPVAVQQSSWMSAFPDGLPVSTPKPQPPPPVMSTPQPVSPTTPVSTCSGVGSNPPIVTASSLQSRSSMGPPLAPAQPVSRVSSQAPPVKSNPGYHIRFSPVQLEYEESKSSIEPHFNVRTNTFKNSVWNRAHYGNPDFHPEEWCPTEEQGDRTGMKRKIKKEPPS